MKILLVEDDAQTAAALTQALTTHHYSVTTVSNGHTARKSLQASSYDLILLDVQLPQLDGIRLCRQLREEGYQLPILLLTATDNAHDRVIGLEAGADDFVSQPFNLPELLARIRALLRRSNPLSPPVLTWENLRLNPETSEVTYADKLLHLTPKEYGLLSLFLHNPQRIFSRSALLDRVWSADEFPGEEAVTTQIKGLRQKLKAAGLQTDPIATLYGLGYRLKSPSEAKAVKQEPLAKEDETQTKTLPLSPSQSPSPAPNQPPEFKVMAAVAALWQDFQPSLTERMMLFEQAIEQLQAGSLDPVVQQDAKAAAHKLIGSLGSFGLLEGSSIAREIEKLLQSEIEPRLGVQLSQQITALKQAIEQFSPPSVPSVTKSAPVPPSSPTRLSAPAAAGPPQLPLLLVIDDDISLTARLKYEATAWNLRIDVALDLKAARAKLRRCLPDIVLLDLNFLDPAENGLTFLAELTQRQPRLPVIMFTAQNHLSNRLEAQRLGSRGFLQKPIGPEQIFQAVKQVLSATQVLDAKVLVVDDDPLVLANVCNLLQPWGFEVTPLADPRQFWETLEVTKPDLLILDIAMPAFSGIELCQVVRNDLRWSQLPILFLSGHTDAETIQQVYTVGADDYVAKPIVSAELIARVLNRLERVQILRKLAAAQKER